MRSLRDFFFLSFLFNRVRRIIHPLRKNKFCYSFFAIVFRQFTLSNSFLCDIVATKENSKSLLLISFVSLIQINILCIFTIKCEQTTLVISQEK